MKLKVYHFVCEKKYHKVEYSGCPQDIRATLTNSVSECRVQHINNLPNIGLLMYYSSVVGTRGQTNHISRMC